MSGRQFFFCSQPCNRYFTKETLLVQHRAHSTLCLARWNAHLSAATRDLLKEPIIESKPIIENENVYLEDIGSLSDDGNIYLDDPHEDSTSGETTDNELELAPVYDPEIGTASETQNHHNGPLGLNDPDLYDTDSGYEPDADDNIWRHGDFFEMPHDAPVGDTIDETDHCPEVDESAESVCSDLYPGAAKVIHTGDPPFTVFAQKQRDIGHGNIYYPFAGPVEWDLARWLHGAGSMAIIDQFLKLKYVSNYKSPDLSIFLT